MLKAHYAISGLNKDAVISLWLARNKIVDNNFGFCQIKCR